MTAQQLKNSILQLAVQGKLVPQDPTDEPASVLLERIRAEKEKLIKEGKIKKEKNPSVIFRGADNTPYEKIGNAEPVSIADEVPFDIPDSWEWCRLSTANDMYTGNSINETEKKLKYTGLVNGYNYIGTKDVGFDHAIDYNNGVKIPFDNDKFRIAPTNSILLCVEGGSAGRKIAFTNQDVCFGNKLCCFVSYGIDYLFLYYYLQCPVFQSAFKDNKTGIIGGVSLNTLKEMFFPVPPLNEQKRIVQRIQEIIPYILEYDNKYNEIENQNSKFPDKLKKSILQMAVQGKLVPQDENDEPTSVLLERIRAEKQNLVAEGKIKKDKNESVIFRRDNSHYEKLNGIERCIDDEIPFEIPDSWVWTRLGSVSEIARGGSPRPIKDYLTESSNGINWIKIGDSDKGGKYINQTKEKIIPEGVNKSRFVHAGDFLLTNSMSFGRPYILNVDGCIHDGWLVISDYQQLYDKDFLYYMLSSSFAYYQFCGVVSGAVVKNLNSDKVAEVIFPVPPIAEQQRIVTEIEKLLPIMKSLEN